MSEPLTDDELDELIADTSKREDYPNFSDWYVNDLAVAFKASRQQQAALAAEAKELLEMLRIADGVETQAKIKAFLRKVAGEK